MILLGAPGAGKGTVAEGVTSRTPFVHLSTGDMLREAIRQGTELGRRADAFIRKGELVPDDLVVGMVFERLDRGAPDQAVMFDGFPRTLEQARLLDEGFRARNAVLQVVFLLEAPRELVIQRLTGRRICRGCGANFHVTNIPPRREGVCDRCGGELYQRPDDTEATIANRLDVFQRQTESLVAYYEKQGKLVRVDASQHRDRTIAEVVAKLG
jgi:adenylate kinase